MKSIRLAALAAIFAMSALAVCPTGTSRVAWTVLSNDGVTPAYGRIVVYGPSGGTGAVATTRTLTIGAAGALDVCLTGGPAYSYRAVWYLTTATGTPVQSFEERWVVPLTSATLTVPMIREGSGAPYSAINQQRINATGLNPGQTWVWDGSAWIAATNAAGGSGMSDPGTNGVMKRTGLNTTGVVTGTATDCVKVDGSSGPCGTGGGGGSAAFSDITGNATDNASLNAALAAKADTSALTSHTSNTSNPHGTTAFQVGLGLVTNNPQLKIASNLSDLANVATARGNLGLGTAALANLGTGAGQIPVTGNYERPITFSAPFFRSVDTVSLPVCGDGQVYKIVTGAWACADDLIGAPGSGEANTASNQGTVGVGVFKGKVGYDLQFYKLNSTNTRATVALNGTDRIDLTINEGNIVHQNLSGAGANTHAQIDSHLANTSNPHNVTKSQVGLGNVDNTSDAAKPISTATATALAAKENAASKGTANGYAPLGSDALVPLVYLPTVPAQLGYTPQDTALKGANNGYAGLDGTGRVPTAQLPVFNLLPTGIVDASTKAGADCGAKINAAAAAAGTVEIWVTPACGTTWTTAPVVGANIPVVMKSGVGTVYTISAGMQIGTLICPGGAAALTPAASSIPVLFKAANGSNLAYMQRVSTMSGMVQGCGFDGNAANNPSAGDIIQVTGLLVTLRDNSVFNARNWGINNFSSTTTANDAGGLHMNHNLLWANGTSSSGGNLRVANASDASIIDQNWFENSPGGYGIQCVNCGGMKLEGHWDSSGNALAGLDISGTATLLSGNAIIISGGQMAVNYQHDIVITGWDGSAVGAAGIVISGNQFYYSTNRATNTYSQIRVIDSVGVSISGNAFWGASGSVAPKYGIEEVNNSSRMFSGNSFTSNTFVSTYGTVPILAVYSGTQTCGNAGPSVTNRCVSADSSGNVALTGTLTAPSLILNDATKSGGEYMQGVTSGGVALAVANAAGTAITYVLPSTNGTAGQVLSDSGSTTCPTLPAGFPATCHLLAWVSSGGTGTVTSATIAGTTNQITVTGTCTITTTGTCTLSLPSTLVLPSASTATTQSTADNSTKVATTAYADAAAAARSKVLTLPFGCAVGDPAGSALATGVLCYVVVPTAGTIVGWDIVVDAGTATVDVLKVATGTAKPTASIAASALPAISTGTAKHSTTLTGWTTSVAANDILGFNLTAVSTAKYITINVQVQF